MAEDDGEENPLMVRPLDWRRPIPHYIDLMTCSYVVGAAAIAGNPHSRKLQFHVRVRARQGEGEGACR